MTAGFLKASLLSLSAIELFAGIAQQEEVTQEVGENHQELTATSALHIAPLALRGIVREGEGDEEDYLQTCSGNYLKSASALVPQLNPQILEFVEDNIHSSDWKLREAALAAASAFQQPPSHILRTILEAFQDKSPAVQKQAVLAFVSFGQRQDIPDAIMDNVLTETLLLLQKREDLCLQCSQIIYEFAPNHVSTFSRRFGDILAALRPFLFFRGVKGEDLDDEQIKTKLEALPVVQEAFSILVLGSSEVAHLHLLQELCQEILAELEKIVQLGEGKETKLQKALKASLPVGLGSLVGRLLALEKNSFTEFLPRTIKVLLFLFQTRTDNSSFEDLCATVSTIVPLCETFVADFEPFVPFFLAPLKIDVAKEQDFTAVSCGVGCFGDIIRALGSKHADWVGDAVQNMLNFLEKGTELRIQEDEEIWNELGECKPEEAEGSVMPFDGLSGAMSKVFSCLGDICLYSPTFIFPHLPLLCRYLQSAFDPTCVTIYDEEFEESQGIRGVFDAYTAIIQSAKENPKVISPFVGPFVDFLEDCVTSWLDLGAEAHAVPLLCTITGIMGDLTHLNLRVCNKILNARFWQKLNSKLKRFSGESMFDGTTFFYGSREINKYLQKEEGSKGVVWTRKRG